MHSFSRVFQIVFMCENVSQLCKEQKKTVRKKKKKTTAKLGKKEKDKHTTGDVREVNPQFWQYDPIRYLE